MQTKEALLLKMGELVLKGLNRSRFEARLLAQIKRRLMPFGNFTYTARQSAITVLPEGDVPDWTGAVEAAGRIFGLAGIARAGVFEKDSPTLWDDAAAYLAPYLTKPCTFKVESRRADKSYPLTSPQISARLGEQLLSAFPHLTVDVRNPERVVRVEIRDYHAFVYAEFWPGAGGLPIGISGQGLLLLSGGIDSPVAGYRMARRGLSLFPVHFYSYPYTSPQAKDKVIQLAKLLALWSGPTRMALVPFTAIQEQLRRACPEGYFTILMRRAMMRIAEELAQRHGAEAVITGESLGQVASQTLEAMAATEHGMTLPVLRPLVGLDKEEIISTARHIGTFETSSLPYEDCCTVFTPRHPKTKPKLAPVLAAEAAADLGALIQKAVEDTEYLFIS